MVRLLALLTSSIIAIDGAFIVLDGPHAGLVAETARFQNYGPPNGDVTAQAVYLDGDDLCHLKAADLRGKVVISRANKYDCGLIEVYRSLAAADAAAFVKDIHIKPPGITTYARDYFGLRDTRVHTITNADD